MLFRDINILFSENCIKQMNKFFAENRIFNNNFLKSTGYLMDQDI